MSEFSSISGLLNAMLATAPKELTAELEAFEKLSHDEQLTCLVDELNAEQGDNLVKCDICRGKGIVYFAEDNRVCEKPCVCHKARKAARLLERSQLKELVEACTFGAYKADEDFQKRLKTASMKYVDEFTGQGWLYLGGQSGAGKTHLAYAIAGELIKKLMGVRLMQWIPESQKLKALINDSEAYNRLLLPLQTCGVLIIDDFFNTKPTEADIKLARSILDNRYINNLATIITSECLLNELIEYDDAIAGRIAERCGKDYLLQISPKAERNYRLRGIK